MRGKRAAPRHKVFTALATDPLAIYKAQPDCTALVAVLPCTPVAVVPASGADLIRILFVPAAAAPRGPATTAPFGPAQPARTTPAAHSTACAVGMTPASRGKDSRNGKQH